MEQLDREIEDSKHQEEEWQINNKNQEIAVTGVWMGWWQYKEAREAGSKLYTLVLFVLNEYGNSNSKTSGEINHTEVE